MATCRRARACLLAWRGQRVQGTNQRMMQEEARGETEHGDAVVGAATRSHRLRTSRPHARRVPKQVWAEFAAVTGISSVRAGRRAAAPPRCAWSNTFQRRLGAARLGVWLQRRRHPRQTDRSAATGWHRPALVDQTRQARGSGAAAAACARARWWRRQTLAGMQQQRARSPAAPRARRRRSCRDRRRGGEARTRGARRRVALLGAVGRALARNHPVAARRRRRRLAAMR